METTFQELHINHTYAEWSKAVGEDITALLVTGFVCSVSDGHNQSPEHLPLKNEREKNSTIHSRFFSLLISVHAARFNL